MESWWARRCRRAPAVLRLLLRRCRARLVPGRLARRRLQLAWPPPVRLVLWRNARASRRACRAHSTGIKRRLRGARRRGSGRDSDRRALLLLLRVVSTISRSSSLHSASPSARHPRTHIPSHALSPPAAHRPRPGSSRPPHALVPVQLLVPCARTHATRRAALHLAAPVSVRHTSGSAVFLCLRLRHDGRALMPPCPGPLHALILLSRTAGHS